MDTAIFVPVGLSARRQCWAHLNWQFLCLFSAPSACRSINIYFLPLLTNQSIMERLRLQRLLKITLSSSRSEKGQLKLLRTLFDQALNIVEGWRCHKTFGNLFQCLTTLMAERFSPYLIRVSTPLRLWDKVHAVTLPVLKLVPAASLVYVLHMQ